MLSKINEIDEILGQKKELKQRDSQIGILQTHEVITMDGLPHALVEKRECIQKWSSSFLMSMNHDKL